MKEWIQTVVLKAVLRHVASVVGAFVVAHGYATSSGWEDVAGAIVTIGTFIASLWDKRDQIKKDVQTEINNTKK